MPVYSPLANPTATKQVLINAGIDPKYSFGQNFLINDAIVGKILRLADIKQGDKILEVGPGLGTLTLALLNSGADVLAIELDADMFNIVNSNVENPNLSFENSGNFKCLNIDALKLTLKDIENWAANSKFKLVSNLPYAAAATIVLDYFQRFSNMTSVTVMVQREVADRMLAAPSTKNYGAYSVKLAMFADYVDRFKVSASNFMPAPRVESSVIRLNTNKKAGDDMLRIACRIADAAFTNRRKTIKNSVTNYFKADTDIADAVIKTFEVQEISTSLRGETLIPQQFLKVAFSLSDSVKQHLLK